MSHLLTALISFAAGAAAAVAVSALLRSRRKRPATRSDEASPDAPAPARAGTGAARPAAAPTPEAPRRGLEKPGVAVRQAAEPAELGPAAATAPRQIAPTPAGFAGRSAELSGLLARADSGLVMLGIFGESGTGRTALALRLCAELSGRFPDAALRLDLAGCSGREPLAAAEALARLLRALHPEVKLPASEAALAAAWRQALAERRVLVLLDDAADLAQVRPLLPPKGSMLVVTSRTALALPGSFSKEIVVPEEADCAAMLGAAAPALAARAAEVGRLCSNLPFAVVLVGRSQAAPPETDPGDCLTALSEAAEASGRGAAAALRTACELAGPELTAFWSALGVFPGSFDAPAAAAVARAPQPEALRMLGELAGRGMVGAEEVGGAKRWRFHELARAAAEERLGQAGRAEAQLRHAVYFLTVLRRAEKLCAAGGESLRSGLALCDLEADNIAAAQAWAAAQAGGDETVAHLCNDFVAAAPTCLALRLPAGARIRWLEAALGAARSLGLAAAEAGHVARLASACAEGGEHGRAQVHAEASLAAARAAGDRAAEANALGWLASSAAVLGEHRRAAAYYEEYLPAVRWLNDRRAEIAALGNLGAELVLIDEPARAAECFDRQLAAAREAGDRRAEGAALNNLSSAAAVLGDHRRSAAAHEGLLAFARAAGDRRTEAAALGRLASAFSALGETARVAECCEAQAAAARESGDRRAECSALANLAAACAALGDHRRSAAAHEGQLAAARALHDPRAEASALAGLGADWLALDEPRRAISFYDQYLAAVAAAAAGGAGPLPGAALHLGNLGRACYAAGEHGRAAEAYGRQLAAAREAGDRKAEANALYNLSLALEQLGRRPEAAGRAREALAAFEELKDPNAARAREQVEKLEKK
ncbi:MAG TPA: tetratricopeptide repeat protein [Planctomycetota bacterium]|nr:tetratricopeptide repeat protein [Planctomycetota bacterium]